jgi:PKD repeat protein
MKMSAIRVPVALFIIMVLILCTCCCITREEKVEVPSANLPPVADAGGDRTCKVNELILFDGSQSYDPDGIDLNLSWDFDASDGIQIDAWTNSPTDSVAHAYTSPGVYTVTLTVSDGELTATTTITVVVVDTTATTYQTLIFYSTHAQVLIKLADGELGHVNNSYINTTRMGELLDRTGDRYVYLMLTSSLFRSIRYEIRNYQSIDSGTDDYNKMHCTLYNFTLCRRTEATTYAVRGNTIPIVATEQHIYCVDWELIHADKPNAVKVNISRMQAIAGNLSWLPTANLTFGTIVVGNKFPSYEIYEQLKREKTELEDTTKKEVDKRARVRERIPAFELITLFFAVITCIVLISCKNRR